MACCLLAAKSLPEPMLAYCLLDSWEQISVKFESELHHFHWRRCIWKCCLPEWRPFCPRVDELMHWDWMTHICINELAHHLVQVTACHLCGDKPLPEPMMTDFQSHPWGQILWNLNQNAIIFMNKIHFKMSSVKWQPLCPCLSVLRPGMCDCNYLAIIHQGPIWLNLILHSKLKSEGRNFVVVNSAPKIRSFTPYKS